MPDEILEFIYKKFILNTKIVEIHILTDDNKQVCNELVLYLKNKNLKVHLFFLEEIKSTKCSIIDKPIFYILSFIGNEDYFISEICNNIEISGNYCLYLDWNVYRYQEKLQNVLIKVYSKAILTDYQLISKKNNDYTRLIKKGDIVRILTNYGTDVIFEIEDGAFEENCKFPKERIVQLPGGEVFWIPKQGSCNGTIKNIKYTLLIQSDIIEIFSTNTYYEIFNRKAPICEFGIGTNPNVKNICGLAFSEKAIGTCHFGIGNNINLGGKYKRDYHFDIVIDNYYLFVNGKEILI